MYKIKINEKECIGCGACVATCEKCFELKSGKAVAKTSKTDDKCAKDAESVCPVSAIKVEKA